MYPCSCGMQFALKVFYSMHPLHVFVCKSSCTLHFCRCFSFGIGSGASTRLVRGIAEAGKGTAEFVTTGERMQPKVCTSRGIREIMRVSSCTYRNTICRNNVPQMFAADLGLYFVSLIVAICRTFHSTLLCNTN